MQKNVFLRLTLKSWMGPGDEAIITHLCIFTEQHIAEFLELHRAKFPHATILPKMPILEDCVIPGVSKASTQPESKIGQYYHY